jgi:hypothetical protein
MDEARAPMDGAQSGDAIPTEAVGEASEVLETDVVSACPDIDRRVMHDRGYDPLDDAIDMAFEKLWRSPPTPAPETDEAARIAAADPDKYIHSYFKQVGELTREAVFTDHHMKGLQRYRDDILRGDRMGRIRDVESQITTTQEEQDRLDAHISKLMRIVRSPRPEAASTEASCCASSNRSADVCCAPSTRPLPACNGDCVLQ